ncbi:MAG: undecaprenyl-diphosphate phosphatase [Eubacteriales bacterium]|nr:undecaprenyl-diphosphate phosphatase [Eubacteriales bacterium]
MDYLKAVLLGLIQGLTEFLPVSSSGHLVLAQRLLGIEIPGVTFEVFLHVGTLISVIWVFRERLANIIKSFLVLFKKEEWARYAANPDRRFGLLLIAASIPTAIIAFLLNDFIEKAFGSTLFVGIALLITGGLLWVADALPGGNKDITKTTALDAVLIGVFQGIAIFPGISRSGATISGALFRKLDKRTAAEFSFLLSIPAILGGALVEVIKIGQETAGAAMDWLFYLAGIVAAAAAGIFAIRFFIRLLVRDRLRIFAVYCWLVGVIVILITL